MDHHRWHQVGFGRPFTGDYFERAAAHSVVFKAPVWSSEARSK